YHTLSRQLRQQLSRANLQASAICLVPTASCRRNRCVGLTYPSAETTWIGASSGALPEPGQEFPSSRRGSATTGARSHILGALHAAAEVPCAVRSWGGC